jgi:prepilin-type N-terminal cleavage/methylation domain-containing protein
MGVNPHRTIDWRMRSRSGLSLVEVLVASVLLAIGVGGTLSAFTAALRLRINADAREAVAARAHDTLSWFESRSCAAADTAADSSRDGIRESWTVRRESTFVRLSGGVAGGTGRAPVQLAIEAVRRCD